MTATATSVSESTHYQQSNMRRVQSGHFHPAISLDSARSLLHLHMQIGFFSGVSKNLLHPARSIRLVLCVSCTIARKTAPFPALWQCPLQFIQGGFYAI